jgi:hypothetical protein
VGLDLQAGQVVADVRDPASREMSAATVSLVATAVLGIVPYRHEYVLMVAWATTFLIALLALVLVGARAFRWDLIGSVAGSALLGSAAGVLASVLDSSDPDGFPSGAVPGAIIGAIMLGLVGLFFNSSVGGADDPVARRVKASLSGIPVVFVLVLLERSAATQVVLGWTRQTPDGPCKTLDPSQPFGACVPKYGSGALRLLAFEIVLLALLFVLQAARAPAARRPDPDG